jgi:hypothetical protein
MRTLSTSTYLAVVVGVAISLTSAITHQAWAQAPPHGGRITISRGVATTTITGGDWPKNAKIDLKVPIAGEPPKPIGLELGADENGELVDPVTHKKVNWRNSDSRVAGFSQINTVVFADIGEPVTQRTQATVIRDEDPHFWIDILHFIGELISAATNTVESTELASAGFVPTSISLTNVSSNAELINQSTSFDASTDTITTTGDYELLGVGPVLGTYTATGTFQGLSDPATGDLLPPSLDTFSFTEQIGDVVPVPEPPAIFLIGTGLVGLVAFRRTNVFKKA